MGLPEGMTAQVTANEPCPAIDRSPGRVVPLADADLLDGNGVENGRRGRRGRELRLWQTLSNDSFQ